MSDQAAESNLAAMTIRHHGRGELQERFLGPLAAGELVWCLLYSEPGAGSDLAAVQTRAERDGDEWVINGQKVWTTFAQRADYGLLLARTDWDVPKHQGITFFFLPMRQSGVEVRPIKQITGTSTFNEVFFTDARVPHASVIGEVNGGWRVLQTALAYERLLMGTAEGAVANIAGRDRTEADADVDAAVETGPVGGYDPVELARRMGRAQDPLVRQELARLHCLRMVSHWNGERARAELKRGSQSPVASIGKLAMSRILHSAARLNAALLGAGSLLSGDGFALARAVNDAALLAYVNSIGGGTDQIQRNILGERVLGLPREPDVDRDVPFRDVRKARATRSFGSR